MKTVRQHRGWLQRLRRDNRGNVMVISALSMIVLAGLGGGGFDMARVYLVKSRLQQACDAGVLAYRRSMQGTNVGPLTWPTAQNFFFANFSPGRYGTFNTQFPQPTVDANVVVHGTASTVVPTSIMQILGVQQVPLATTCDAQLQLPNTDVMFVLDTTLSMTCEPSGSNCSSGANSKIVSLRNAVQNFYNTLQAAKVNGTQVRYGFVPYSSTVNVGLLLKPNWLADTWHYQSREYNSQVTTPGSPQAAYMTTYGAWTYQSGSAATYTSTISPENCVAPSNTQTTTTTYGAWSPSATAIPRTRTDSQTVNGSTYSASLSNGVCTVTEKRYTNYIQTITETYQQNPNAGQTGASTTTYYWNYKQVDYPQIATLKAANGNGLASGGSFVAPKINTNQTDKTIHWGDATRGACIEERDSPYDMDVDTVPNPGQPATQWRPGLPDLVYARSFTTYNPPSGSWTFAPITKTTANYVSMTDSGAIPSLHASCPTSARKLDAALTSSALTTYLNSLTPSGKTYHDIGFMWGLRLMSGEGIFASENAATPSGGAIARNLIFMTDGDTETDITDYDAFGLAALDRRRTDPSTLPTNSQQDAIVENRLSTLCTLAKSQKNITVWVIAFGTTLTPLLSNCATSGRAYQASDAASLNATFADIAARISQLRLTR